MKIYSYLFLNQNWKINFNLSLLSKSPLLLIQFSECITNFPQILTFSIILFQHLKFLTCNCSIFLQFFAKILEKNSQPLF